MIGRIFKTAIMVAMCVIMLPESSLAKKKEKNPIMTIGKRADGKAPERPAKEAKGINGAIEVQGKFWKEESPHLRVNGLLSFKTTLEQMSIYCLGMSDFHDEWGEVYCGPQLMFEYGVSLGWGLGLEIIEGQGAEPRGSLNISYHHPAGPFAYVLFEMGKSGTFHITEVGYATRDGYARLSAMSQSGDGEGIKMAVSPKLGLSIYMATLLNSERVYKGQGGFYDNIVLLLGMQYAR